MAGKKTKQATAKRMAREKPHANNNDHTSDGVATQASTLRAPSKKIKTVTTSPVVASPSRPAVGMHDTIFALPLEIREIVCNHVLTTGIVDTSTNSRVVIIGERRELREGSTSSRKHDYTTDNFKPKQLSITRVCKQMREDVKAMTWPKTVFRFTSTVALSRFVGHLGYRGTNKEVAQLNVALLHQVKKIECEVGDQKGKEWHLDYLHDVKEQLDRPLAMSFFDTISPDDNKGPQGPQSPNGRRTEMAEDHLELH